MLIAEVRDPCYFSYNCNLHFSFIESLSLNGYYPWWSLNLLLWLCYFSYQKRCRVKRVVAGFCSVSQSFLWFLWIEPFFWFVDYRCWNEYALSLSCRHSNFIWTVVLWYCSLSIYISSFKWFKIMNLVLLLISSVASIRRGQCSFPPSTLLVKTLRYPICYASLFTQKIEKLIK